MRPRSRYRIEDGKSCIDVRLKSSRQLFDLRDPAPFRERDLDPGAVEHLMTCLREIPRRSPVRITLFLAEAGELEPHVDAAVIKDAIRAHFEHERDLVDNEIRENFRHGRRLFALGLGILALFLTLSKLSTSLLHGGGHLTEILKEGLVITGWVAMWKPAEVLLYDWWPLFEKRRWILKLLSSDIDVQSVRSSMLP